MFAFNVPTATEIVTDVYRIGLYAPESDLQFNFFLVRDDQPLLFTTGFRGTFPAPREAVARVIDPVRIRWVAYTRPSSKLICPPVATPFATPSRRIGPVWSSVASACFPGIGSRTDQLDAAIDHWLEEHNMAV